MKNRAVFYHAGCPVCVAAEHQLLELLDRQRLDLEVVHLGEQRQRIAEAESKGVNSVPALVVEDQVLHINFGAALTDLN